MTKLLYAESIPQPIPSVYPLPILRDCSLLFDMQESGNKVIDHSGRGNHGTNSGSTIVAGHTGLVRSFGPVADDKITVTKAASINAQGRTAMSFALWVRKTIDGDLWLFEKNETAWTAGYRLSISATGKLTAVFYAVDATAQAVATNSISSNVWRFLAGVYNEDGDGKIKLYENAALQGLDTNTAGTGGGEDDSSLNLIVGCDFGGTKGLVGLMGRTYIWTRALPAAEIRELYRRDSWRYGLAA